MTSNNNHHLPDPERETNPDPDADLLSPKDVARRLGVCTKTATRIMKELPHVCVSLGISSRKKRIRITERTLNDFKEGRIERSSIENDEEGSNDVSK